MFHTPALPSPSRSPSRAAGPALPVLPRLVALVLPVVLEPDPQPLPLPSLQAHGSLETSLSGFTSPGIIIIGLFAFFRGQKNDRNDNCTIMIKPQRAPGSTGCPRFALPAPLTFPVRLLPSSLLSLPCNSFCAGGLPSGPDPPCPQGTPVPPGQCLVRTNLGGLFVWILGQF